MNIGISQLAFENISDIIEMLEYLTDLNINNIEIVLSKYNNIEEAITLKSKLNLYKIKTLSTQSILFNSKIKDFTDFNLMYYMSNLIEKCKLLNVDTLILGSPSCRNMLDYSKLKEIFGYIDSLLINSDKILCIEPNCKKYNGKYFHSISEIVDFITDCGFSNIKSMIDTHNIKYEGSDPQKCYEEYLEYIYHIHISEDNLSPFLISDSHYNLSDSIKNSKYNKTITYEVLPHANIKESIKNFSKIYGNINEA